MLRLFSSILVPSILIASRANSLQGMAARNARIEIVVLHLNQKRDKDQPPPDVG